ncbi:MAG: hypothetical protein AB1730_20405 [Myxococcota bacterium]|jgi:hypothetical protein
MTGNRLIGLALGLAVGLAVYFFWPKPKHTPEEEVRALVAKAVDAAQRRDAAGVTEALAEDFRGPQASSKQEVKQLVLGHLMRNRDAVVVLNPVLHVTVESPDKASFQGTFIFARAPVADWQNPAPGDGASRYDIGATVERRDGEWVITTATWER